MSCHLAGDLGRGAGAVKRWCVPLWGAPSERRSLTCGDTGLSPGKAEDGALTSVGLSLGRAVPPLAFVYDLF